MSFRSSVKLGLATAAVVAVPFVMAASASASYVCSNESPNAATPLLGPAVACTTVTETVTGTALTLTAPSEVAAGSTTLGAVDKTTTYSIGETTGDNTGTGNGWQEAIAQTPFTSGAHTLGANTASGSLEGASGAAVTHVAEANVADSTNTAPTGSEPATPVDVPVPSQSSPDNSGSGGNAVVFETAAVNSGLGNFLITPTVTVDVPANAYAGAYTATTEVDLSTGP